MTMKFQNIIAFLLLISGATFAQEAKQDSVRKVDGIKIYIGGEAQVTYSYGKKIHDDPLFQDTTTIKTEVEYEFLDKQVPSNFKVKTIKAPKINIQEPLEKIHKRYVAVGINDFKTSPMAELRYSTLRNRDYSAGFDMSHFSQKQGVGGAMDALYGNSEIDFYGKKFYDKKTLYGSANYENNTVNFYGLDQDQFLFFDEDDLKRGIGKFDVVAGLKSNEKDESKWNYDLNLNYNELSLDNMAVVENKVDLNANVKKYMEWKKHTWFKGDFNLDYVASYLNSGRPLGDYESFFFKVFPSFDFKFKELDLKVGVQAFYQTDNKKFNGMPFLEADFAFVKNVMHIYGRFQNDYQRLSYLDYVYENPFVANYEDVLNMNSPIDFTGGVKGSISKTTTFNVGFQLIEFKSMPLYYNLASNPLMEFNIITDKVTNRKIFAELVHEGTKLGIIAKGEYNSYDVYKNEAYQLPAIYAETRSTYKLQDKFVLGTDLFFYGQQVGLDSFDNNGRPVTNTIDPIFDFNIDLRYNYSKKLGAFIRTNNIMNTKHQRWDQYANYGFNMLFGLDYNF